MNYDQSDIQKIIQDIPGGSVVYRLVDNRLKIVAASDAIAAGTGFTNNELLDIVQRNPFDIIYEADRDSFQKDVINCFRNGGDLSCSVRILSKSSDAIWVHFRGKLLGEMNGDRLLLATVQDISDIGKQMDMINLVPTGLGIYVVENGIITQSFLNKGYFRMLGVRRDDRSEYRGIGAINSVHPADRPIVNAAITEAFSGRTSEFCITVRMLRSNENDFIWIQLDGLIAKRKGNLCVCYVSFTDVDKGVKLREQLHFDSEHDPLTKLYNREKTYLECDRLLAAHPDEAFGIVRFDIQKFRLYNSFYGEAEGDRLLCYFADIFRGLSNFYPYGVYGHSHADVFLLCFPMSDGILEWNKKLLHEKLLEYRSDFFLEGSSGIYISTGPHDSAKVLFNKATVAAKCNMNKQSNPVILYNQDMEDELLRIQRISGEMRIALNEHQFVVYLQPKYETTSDTPFGAEALVRWIHPTDGMISPNSFIPIFESNGFITQLDRYMWEEVCILIRRWLDEGRQVNPISVNVSRVSMYTPQMVSFLSDLVKRYQIPTNLLQLELTESSFMSDPEIMKERIFELQKHGFKIMMDDFGSAYSSLNSLQELPFDFLKVDKKFLDAIEQNQRSRTVLSSVVHMVSSLSIPVITEGVETQQQRDFVASIGSDYIQGYFYARPMPVAEYEEKILLK